jgi:alpha-tubulin suppressor-like RCC1 family protein
MGAVLLCRHEFIRKPKRVSALGSTKITQVTIGGWHCLALGERGDVYAWVCTFFSSTLRPPTQGHRFKKAKILHRSVFGKKSTKNAL